jgi:hypothetical protein
MEHETFNDSYPSDPRFITHGLSTTPLRVNGVSYIFPALICPFAQPIGASGHQGLSPRRRSLNRTPTKEHHLIRPPFRLLFDVTFLQSFLHLELWYVSEFDKMVPEPPVFHR